MTKLNVENTASQIFDRHYKKDNHNQPINTELSEQLKSLYTQHPKHYLQVLFKILESNQKIDANAEISKWINLALKEKKPASFVSTLFENIDATKLGQLVDQLSDQSLKQIMNTNPETFKKLSNSEQFYRLWVLSPQNFKDHPLIQQMSFPFILKGLTENPNLFIHINLAKFSEDQIKHMIQHIFSSHNLSKAFIKNIYEHIPDKIKFDIKLWSSILTNNPEVIKILPDSLKEYILKANPGLLMQLIEQYHQEMPEQVFQDSYLLDLMFQEDAKKFFTLVETGVIAYAQLSDELKTRSDLSIAALRHNIENIKYIPDKVLENKLFIKNIFKYVPMFAKLVSNGTIDYDALDYNQKAQYLESIDPDTRKQEIQARVHQGILFNDFIFCELILGRKIESKLLLNTLAARPDLHVKIFKSFVDNHELHNLSPENHQAFIDILNQLKIPIEQKTSIIMDCLKHKNSDEKQFLQICCQGMIKAEIGKFIEEIKQPKYQELGLDVEALEKTYQRFDNEQVSFFSQLLQAQQKMSPEKGLYNWLTAIVSSLKNVLSNWWNNTDEKTLEDKKSEMHEKLSGMRNQFYSAINFDDASKDPHKHGGRGPR